MIPRSCSFAGMIWQSVLAEYAQLVLAVLVLWCAVACDVTTAVQRLKGHPVVTCQVAASRTGGEIRVARPTAHKRRPGKSRRVPSIAQYHTFPQRVQI